MIEFGNCSFHETEVARMEKENRAEMPNAQYDPQMPYVLVVYLKSGVSCARKYKSMIDRDRKYIEFQMKIDAFYNGSNNNLEKEIEKLRYEIKRMSAELEAAKGRTLPESIKENTDNSGLRSDTDLIESLELSFRSINALKRGGFICNEPIRTIGDLRKYGVAGIRKFRNIGSKSLKEICEQVLARTGKALEE